ncbi:hypothetical protein ABPG72_000344, partial [Tetrahymena utriculariae]
LKIYGTVEQPIFVVNDICKIIEIDNKSRMIMRNKKRKGQDLAVVNERGLYEIMFRSNSQIMLISLKMKFLNCQINRDSNKIFQYNRKSQNKNNIEKIYSVITIHKVDYDFDPEDDEEDFDIISCPQIICVTKNPYQIFIDYTTKLNNHYKQELNYYYVVLQDKLKKDEALQFKNDYLNNVFGCNKQQHHSRQW